MTDKVDKKKRKLSEIDFSHTGAHVALVGPSVGGPANQQQTVLFKSKATGHITDDDMKAVLKGSKSAEQVELEKAKFNSEVRSALRVKVEEQFAGKYEWLYLEDFSDSEIVFSSEAGMFIVGYSLSGDDDYILEDQAVGVEYKSILVENGSLKLSKDAQEKLKEGVYSLVTKALDNPETNERVIGVLKSIEEKAKTMQEEIQKAVDAAKAEAAAELVKVQEELQKAKDVIAVVEAEKKATVMKAREAQVAAFDKEGAEALVKATEGLNDEAFAVIVKSLEAKQKQVEQSDLFVQKSTQEAEDKVEESATVALIKAQMGNKQ